MIRYGDKIEKLAKSVDDRAIRNERTFVRRKIDESKNEIRQLENNLLFFSDASEENPLVKEVVRKIDKQKEVLSTWKLKLKRLNIMEHKLSKGELDSEIVSDQEE